MLKLLKDLAALAIGIIEVLLIFRFILRLLAANPNSVFVNWIYVNTAPLLQPFIFAFPNPAVASGFVIEFTTLFAVFAYAFLGFVLQEILEILVDQKR